MNIKEASPVCLGIHKYRLLFGVDISLDRGLNSLLSFVPGCRVQYAAIAGNSARVKTVSFLLWRGVI